jgi:hypothetical protein
MCLSILLKVHMPSNEGVPDFFSRGMLIPNKVTPGSGNRPGPAGEERRIGEDAAVSRGTQGGM